MNSNLKATVQYGIDIPHMTRYYSLQSLNFT